MKRKPVRASKRKTLKRPRQPATRSTTKAQPRLGDNIKEARQRKGMTQLTLAHAIGYQGSDAGAYISRVESNSQAPRIDTLSRIADALGVAVCSLLPGREK
jgi:transcriptional regulator with XRE-family HTH domain